MKIPKLFVYVVIADSEHGDHYGPWCFASPPSDLALKRFLMQEFKGTEAFDSKNLGPGTWGSHLHVSTPIKVQVRP